jgi:beta-lactamase regulating signal transducer with metallopeptidase domain
MTTSQFLAEWALRSSILIVSGALLLRALCVKDASIRLAAWVGMLCGSLLLPMLTPVLPGIPLKDTPLTTSAPERWEARTLTAQPNALVQPYDLAPTPAAAVVRSAREFASFRWQGAALTLYFLGTAVLLVRLLGGLLLSRRLSLASRATGRTIAGIEIRESDRVTTPVALGVTRPVILLPDDWRLWERAKLEVVLAHECSHVRRKDPLVQLLSAIHRAMLWFSPLSWFLHQRIVRVAEEASDDAAVAFTHDRASYAEVLLEFVQRATGAADWRALDPQSVAMSRRGKMDARISRILDSTSLSRGLTRGSLLAILVLGVPLTLVVAASQVPVAPAAPATPVAVRTPAAPQSPPAPAVPQTPVAPAAPSAFEGITSVDGSTVQTRTARAGDSIRRYMIVSGDSMTGSWDSDYPSQYTELRKKYGPKFVWFSKGGNDYVVTDAGVLEELHEAMAPQNEVNRMQGEVNRMQDTVNQHQADVNRAQGEVNAIQDRVNRRQDLINELQNAQGNDDLIRKLENALAQLRANRSEVGDQESANREQDKVNVMQERVNQEQSKVNEQQDKVNRAQEKVSQQLQGRVEAILESALPRHLARQIQ